MNSKKKSKDDAETPALRAFRRAGKNALELGLRTGTPVWVLVNGKMVDATKRTRKK